MSCCPRHRLRHFAQQTYQATLDLHPHSLPTGLRLGPQRALDLGLDLRVTGGWVIARQLIDLVMVQSHAYAILAGRGPVVDGDHVVLAWAEPVATMGDQMRDAVGLG